MVGLCTAVVGLDDWFVVLKPVGECGARCLVKVTEKRKGVLARCCRRVPAPQLGVVGRRRVDGGNHTELSSTDVRRVGVHCLDTGIDMILKDLEADVHRLRLSVAVGDGDGHPRQVGIDLRGSRRCLHACRVVLRRRRVVALGTAVVLLGTAVVRSGRGVILYGRGMVITGTCMVGHGSCMVALGTAVVSSCRRVVGLRTGMVGNGRRVVRGRLLLALLLVLPPFRLALLTGRLRRLAGVLRYHARVLVAGRPLVGADGAFRRIVRCDGRARSYVGGHGNLGGRVVDADHLARVGAAEPVGVVVPVHALVLARVVEVRLDGEHGILDHGCRHRGYQVRQQHLLGAVLLRPRAVQQDAVGLDDARVRAEHRQHVGRRQVVDVDLVLHTVYRYASVHIPSLVLVLVIYWMASWESRARKRRPTFLSRTS